MNQSKTAIAALILTAILWGLSYSAQADAMNYLQPLVFVALRYLLGTFMLLIAIAFTRKKAPAKPVDKKQLFIGGAACGVFLAGGEIIQQFGLLYTTAGKAGFLTALYVIMIPVIGIFLRKRTGLKIWSAAVISVVGSTLLCATGSDLLAIGNKGDILMILCALFFAFQFIAIAKYAPDAEALPLACIQFATVTVISAVAALAARESWQWQQITAAAYPLLYCGLIAIGIACTIQVAAQKYVHPATASIILSTASVFAVIWDICLNDQHYTIPNFIGCALIFFAVVLVQLPEKSPVKRADN
jgi:drug/metabolite transporter (DMT)-like permease